VADLDGTDSGADAVHTGEAWVAPYGAGPLSLNGAVEAIVCCPPALGKPKRKE
jgi:hypothetical protein